MARPREFDPDVALERAMHVFWENGYEGTSMSDLVERTGVHRGSLYSTFGSKEKIFLAVLSRYATTHGMNFLVPILESDHPVADLKQVVWDRFEEYVAGKNLSGCLIGNTLAEVTPADEEVFDRVAMMVEKRGELFEQILRRAQQLGELAGDRDPVALARCLNTFLLGLTLHVRLQPEAGSMRESIEIALGLLD